MFIHDPNKSLFEVMMDHDNTDDPHDRWKELRNGVHYYNMHNGTRHELNKELLRDYWVFLAACGCLVDSYRN
jgi:hypothetical protein